MSHPDRITDVTAAYGQAHQYWDIYFTDLQRSYADATEDMRSISIDIDTASGAIRLNPGYAEGSPEFARSEEHTSELQSLMRISYAVFCLKKNKTRTDKELHHKST